MSARFSSSQGRQEPERFVTPDQLKVIRKHIRIIKTAEADGDLRKAIAEVKLAEKNFPWLHHIREDLLPKDAQTLLALFSRFRAQYYEWMEGLPQGDDY